MEVSFYLKRPETTTETSIFARICYHGFKLKYYTSERINPLFWNKATQRVKETKKFREYPEFNTRLNNLESSIRNIYRRFINDNGNVIPSPQTLKTLLDRILKEKEEKPVAKTFFSLFQEIIEQSENGTRLSSKSGKPIGRNTYKTYKTVFEHLSNFQKTRKKPIDFETIDLDFYASYTEYLMKRVKLASNTIGKHIQVIKLILNEATERGLNTNLAFKSKRFVSPKEETDSIFLSESELQDLNALDLSSEKRLERVRDLFLIGCYTGLRYSDFSVLQPGSIKNGFIETTQVKTGKSIVIPVHSTVMQILEKYEGRLPKAISNQKTNEFLKEIGSMVPSLNVDVSKSITKGGVRVVQNFKKWELLSTHTARRSFSTNEYLAGTPAITIMAITGHKTEKAFLGYLKVTPSEHAKILKQQWQKGSELQAV